MSTKQSIVKGPRIKVEVEPPREEKSAGGIIMATDIKNQEDGEEGVVVQLGHLAYGNFTDNWCEEGDRVFFQRYSGKPREELADDGTIKYYRIIKDIDVIAVIKERKEENNNGE